MIPLKRIPNEVRKAVYRRDDYRCVLCGDNRAIHVHHVRHRSQGGQSILANLVCLCPACHAIAHGETVLKNQFPFDQATVKDAIAWYLYEARSFPRLE